MSKAPYVPDVWEVNPTHKEMRFTEKCTKEKKYYDQWQAADHKKTKGYLGNKYKINDGRKRDYMPDKITQMTPSLPYKK